MSKYLKESRQASEWALRRPGRQEVDVQQVLDHVKQGSVAGSIEVADTRLRQCQKVHIAHGNNSHLVLESDNSSNAASEAYRGLRTRLMRIQAESGMRSIALTSTAQGEGKTLTTLNLALCYAQLPDLRVLVIDADLRSYGLTRLLDRPGTIGLAQVLAGEANPGEAILATDRNNLYVLPAGMASTPPPEFFAGTRWQELLNWCSETFNVVLVDTPPVTPLADFELICPACDGVVMVVRAHNCERERLEKTISMLDKRKFRGVVYNASDLNPKDYYGYGYGISSRLPDSAE
jgi:polysaccharide biosynthesis transport protein